MSEKRSTCYRCGKGGHLSERCRFREATCHNCQKKGHIASVCRGKGQYTPAGGSQREGRRKTLKSSLKYMEAAVEDPDSDLAG